MSRASFTVPVRSRTQTASSTNEGDEKGIVCNHQVPAKRFMSRTQANPNRWYYACARDREDPKRCKFFKWEDELDKSKGNVLGGASPAKGQTLGAAPGTPSRLMRPTPGSATPRKIGLQSSAAGSTTPSKSGSRTPSDILKAVSAGSAGISTPSAKRLRRWNEPKDDIVSVPDSEEEGSSDIDWGSVDTDKLEEEARSQTNTPRAVRYDNAPVTDTKKRKLSTLAEDDGNPFLITRDPRTPSASRIGQLSSITPASLATPTLPPTTPGGTAPPHPALGAMMTAMDDLREHLARQDRHVRAAQTMKQSMRESIRSLQERIKELEGGEGSEPVLKLQEKITRIGDENLKLKERIRQLEEKSREKDAVIQAMTEEAERRSASS